jgi:hypothetical protein
MGTVSKKLSVGIAGCAIAAAATLTPIAPAEAAPVPVPATPAVMGHGDAPAGWWWFRSAQLPRPTQTHTFGIFHGLFNFWGCYNHKAM